MPSLRLNQARLALLGLALLAAPAVLRSQTPAPAPGAPPNEAAASASSAASMEDGRALTAAFLAGSLDKIWSRFNAQMKTAMKNDPKTLAAFQQQVVGQLGGEKALVSEEMRPAGDYTLYVRTVNMEKFPLKRFLFQWAVGRNGEVGGFLVQEAPEAVPTAFDSYKTKTALQLPFDGDWYVFWGGHTIAQNYHAANAEQRFAYDFVVRRNGATHSGDGKALTDYYAFGQPIYAPGAGTVVKIVDGNADLAPGTVDPKNPAGNHVIIDHGNGEFSVLAHLKYASIVVSVGDTVKAGDRIGACGNTGNTSEPHLHFHMQNAAAMFADAKGLPAQFRDYVADGRPVLVGEPVRGQTISRTAPPK